MNKALVCILDRFSVNNDERYVSGLILMFEGLTTFQPEEHTSIDPLFIGIINDKSVVIGTELQL